MFGRQFVQGIVVAGASATAATVLLAQNNKRSIAHAADGLVCSSCHSIERLAFRNLVDNIYTEDEAKALAADIEVPDEPDETGKPRMRPAKLSDHIPGPYKNAQEARSSNAGALPPDLSLIIKARHGGPDYVFALITGYRNKPEGVVIGETLHYNPYFPGGGIAMAQALYEDVVDYDDGTPTSPAQYAKDVVEFLAWAAEPEAEQRKRMGLKFMLVLALTAIPAFYYKRFKFAPVKNRVVKFMQPKNMKEKH